MKQIRSGVILYDALQKKKKEKVSNSAKEGTKDKPPNEEYREEVYMYTDLVSLGYFS